jgi:pimeloyl-ACP methyl ester carboxylesterase
MENIPIILLHGAGGFSWTLIPLKLSLQYNGFNNIYIVDYNNNCKISDCINNADKQIEKVVNKSKEIIVIGQSLGGVVGINLHRKGWNIKKLITIVSPLKGARFIGTLDYYIPYIFRFFRRQVFQDLLNMTQSKLEVPPHPIHTITTSIPISNNFDGCVYRDEASINDKDNTHILYSGHRILFIDPRLFTTVRQIINKSL